MVGSALGSGPFGEMVAIEWLQIVAGTPMVLMMFVLLFAMMKRVSGQIDDRAVASVGYGMVIASGFAAVVYLIGLACVHTGLMWEGMFPYRLPQNFLGSGLFFLIGFVTYKIPKAFGPFDKWLDRSRQERNR